MVVKHKPRLAFNVETGDQTSKRSDEQYKYEEKMCGLSPKAQPSEKQISTYVVKSGMKNTRLADLKALYAWMMELVDIPD